MKKLTLCPCFSRTLTATATVALLLLSRDLTAETTGSAAGGTAIAAAKFDANQAFEHLKAQVEGGPRIPGSPGLQHTRKLIFDILNRNGWLTGKQDFAAHSGLLGETVAGQNIYGIYPKGSKVKYMISAHYDTRPYADQDPDPLKRKLPVPGANDGASGVAVLLELARGIPGQKLPHGVALAFFDLEDHGGASDNNGFCKGSRHMAANLPPELNFDYGINLDMVGDKDLKLAYESFSFTQATALTERLWNMGISLFPNTWTAERGPFVFDDHMPFLTTGRAYIDVIDFDYKPWHTTADTVDKCSPQSLDIVGSTMQKFIQN